jgi:hypothetical protein
MRREREKSSERERHCATFKKHGHTQKMNRGVKIEIIIQETIFQKIMAGM